MRTTEIKRGEFNAYYMISKLKMANVNRDIFTQHAENFKDKLTANGWMMPIVVSSKGDVIEGHHRIISAKLLNQETIPAYIVDWVDTTIETEHLNCIISLNNGNRAWTTLDYLKAFSKENQDYKKVYDVYLKNSNNISVGNVVNCFFTTSNGFKNGKSTIKNLDFSMFLIGQISKLVAKYGKSNVQAYCVREMIAVAFTKAYGDYNAMTYLFKEYALLAKNEHPAATSISKFKPMMELNLSIFNKDANN
jgi:hypothetical protein